MTTLASTRPEAHTSEPWSELAAGVAASIGPAAEEHDRRGDFVIEAFARLRAVGLLTMGVPAELGGGGATHAGQCSALRVLGRSCGATAVTLSMHAHLVATQVWRHRHGHDAASFLRRVVDDDLLLVSTGAADWVDSSGEAVPVAGGYRVSGRKAPSSGAPAGDVVVTSFPVRPEPGSAGPPDGPGSIIHCAVGFDAPGVHVEETWDALGLRATGSHTVVFDDVFVPTAAVSTVRPRGWHPLWNAVLGSALPLIMSAYLGIGEAAVELARDRARSRSAEPHVAPAMGEMLNALTVATDAVSAMVVLADDLRFPADDAVAAGMLTRKSIAADHLLVAARHAIDILGGAAYSRSCAFERLYRDLHGAGFHPLPTAKQVRFTGRLALGLPPLG